MLEYIREQKLKNKIDELKNKRSKKNEKKGIKYFTVTKLTYEPGETINFDEINKMMRYN